MIINIALGMCHKKLPYSAGFFILILQQKLLMVCEYSAHKLLSLEETYFDFDRKTLQSYIIPLIVFTFHYHSRARITIKAKLIVQFVYTTTMHAKP